MTVPANENDDHTPEGNEDDDTSRQPNDDADPASGDDTDDDNRQRSGENNLGDPGKRALNAMKRERNLARNELREVQRKLKEFEDANKSDTQRLQESAEEFKTRADKAEQQLRRFQVAMDKAPEHATLAQVRAVAKRLHGETDEDLEDDADELFGLLAPAPSTEESKPRVSSKPTERMPRGGGDPDEPPEETDPRKLAALVPRAR